MTDGVKVAKLFANATADTKGGVNFGFVVLDADGRATKLHAHFTLNGKKVNIPSILVKPGDVISVKEASRDSAKIKGLAEALESKNAPKWLDVDKTNLTAKVVSFPAREDIDFDFNEQLIVELYSK